MEFKLNEYHKNITDKDMIFDIKQVAESLHKDTLTIDEYNKFGSYHSATICRKFGSWKKALLLSNLYVNEHNFKIEYSLEDVIIDIKEVANKLNVKSITVKQYNKNGKYNSSTLQKKFGAWNSLLIKAGLEISENRNILLQDLYEDIKNMWSLLGRQPTTTDLRKGISKYSLQTYTRRFGGWRNALQSFIYYINAEENDIEEKKSDKSIKIIEIGNENNKFKHKTNRDINLRLRFLVLKRDNFKCVTCGASPAKNPNIELHVDHIIPWAKGGETTIDNLQTLCSDCNLGKSDL